jgi:hypothetical protein
VMCQAFPTVWEHVDHDVTAQKSAKVE